MAEDQIRSLDRRGADIDGRREHAGNAPRRVGLQDARHLASDVQRECFIDRCASRAAAVENVGAGLQNAVADHFTDESNALAALLLHLGRHIFLVGVIDHIADLIEATILREGRFDVVRNQRVCGRSDAFGQHVRR